MVKRIVIFLSFLLLTSCAQHEAGRDNVIALTGEKLDITEDISLFKLAYVDDSLLVATTFSRTHLLTAFDLKHPDREPFEFVRLGRGPMEIQKGLAKSRGDTLYILARTPYGFSGTKKIPVKDIWNSDAWSSYEHRGKSINVLSGFDTCETDEYLLLGGEWEETQMLTVFNEREETFHPVKFWPEDGFNGPALAKQTIYLTGDVFSRNDKILYACDLGCYASILDRSTEPITEIKLYGEFPIYTVADNGLAPKRSEKNRRGVYAYATDDLIYLGAIENKIVNGQWFPETFKGYEPYCIDVLDVFDWDGNNMFSYRLDVPFSNFYVKDDDSVLYTLTMSPDTGLSEVYKYELPRKGIHAKRP